MIEIKKINRTDLDDLSLLHEELSKKKTDFEIMVNNFEWMANNESYILLGAKVDGKLIGSLMGIICLDLVGSCQPFMVIENVIVTKSLRGQGVGKELMNEIEKIGKENNCHYMMFVSGAHRKDAHKFYESLGYKPDAVQGFKKYLE
jgi:GNAT superfamily N-acetyltransferase